MKRTNMVTLKYSENDKIQVQKSYFKHFDSDKAKKYRRNLALELKESLTEEQNFLIFNETFVQTLNFHAFLSTNQ